ncbi:starch synthase [Endozoicomonas sp. OPT23]|uniref:glycogen synthase n=1 Tax=Endozoicomonas sp. OPT23 TaxID=2072845 RepID=UPI00129AF0E8|nr:glycogen synthase [Endozoicomonas sp. OPT23]MRI32347.1 starch synthase [Endozoicomonas sp. OPT23]
MASKSSSELNVLFAVSEYDGIVKTGGLADAAGALAPVMKAKGHNIRVIMPAYREALAKIETRSVASGAVAMNHEETLWFGLRHGQLNGIDIYFVEYNDFYDRDGIYSSNGHGFQDNSRRFAFFCKAALEACRVMSFQPDVIHCHDWPTALLPYYLRVDECQSDFFKTTRSLLTIHNAAYQQHTGVSQLDGIGVSWRYFNSACFEDCGQINLLKGGIAFADKINAVSPSYGRELLTEAGSHGLVDSFRRRQKDLTGILNGCDYQQWNPETDQLIPTNYSSTDLSGKQLCKEALQKRMGLPVAVDKPVYGLVSRLAEQKGFSFLMPALWQFLNQDVQVVMLGSGDSHTASELRKLADYFPDKCSFYDGFDNALAHQIEAGADFFLMPSLFEPCGLNQIYSLKYATLPVVRRVGGLIDTVDDYDASGSEGTGFAFDAPEPGALLSALHQSLDVYRDSDQFDRMRKQAMACNFDWQNAADSYCSVYQSMIC